MDAQKTGPTPIVTLALQLLGAIAGLTALTTFAGGAMLWIRFDELHLPADQAVTVLPKQLLLTIGAHAMLGPVALGVLAAVLLALIAPWRTDRPRAFYAVLGAILLVVAFVMARLVASFDWYPEQFLMLLTLALAVTIVVAVAVTSERRSTLTWTVVVAFAVCGAVLAIVRTSGAPKLEPVAVLLDGRPQSIAGFYVGQTSDRLYVAPLPGTGDPGDPFADAEIDRVVEIDRDKVLALVLREPTGIRTDEPGREQAQSLLADLRRVTADPAAAADETITTSDPVTAFAPLVNLHVKEPAWPMSADAFLDESWLAWSHADCRDWVQATADADGTHTDDVARAAELRGAFDRTRLAGPDAYTHPAADAGCGETAAPVPADAHTRPFDAKGRPDGLSAREGFYLDLRNGARTPRPEIEKEGPQRFLHDVPVYYELHDAPPIDGRRASRITYWFFYGLSQPPGPAAATRFLVHEGDWERISVLLREGDGPSQYVPQSVRYHAHDGSRDVAWAAVSRVAVGTTEATHPVVYGARGSHASYWRAGTYENVFNVGGKRAFAVRDVAIACPDCPQWRTWEELRDATTQPWYGFGGAWGAVGGIGGTTGPLGPSRYKLGGASPSSTTTVGRADAPTAPPPR